MNLGEAARWRMKYKIKLFYSAQDGGWIAVWKDGDDTVSAFGDTPDEALHEFADALYLFRNSNWFRITQVNGNYSFPNVTIFLNKKLI